MGGHTSSQELIHSPHPSWVIMARGVAGRLLAKTWVGLGLFTPLLLALLSPETLLNDSLTLTLVLMLFAIAGSNVRMPFISGSSDMGYSPVGAPIVLAIVGCTPSQAMLVASIGYILDLATWKKSKFYVLENAGQGAMTTGIAAWILHLGSWSYETHASTLIVALTGSILFLALDALTYAIWFHFESSSGGTILRYFLRTAPLDITFTAIAVALAGPFQSTPALLAIALVACQLAIYSLSRMLTSESRYREQSHHLRDTFGRYVPESIVDQLTDAGTAVTLGGEQRFVTVMFCDIRGFTTWAEGQPPEQVVGELNGLLGSLAEIVMKHGGTLDKFTGDGLMAFWGAPLDQPDHAELACKAAFDMQELLVRRARDQSVTPFRIGIGITSGLVVVGNVGHEKRLEYTAIGDTVNLAARLEQATKELEVTTALAHDTWTLLPSELQKRCPEASTICVRGRTQPVLVHELVLLNECLDNNESRNISAL